MGKKMMQKCLDQNSHITSSIGVFWLNIA